MTDRNKRKKKTEFGADREADYVLEQLPRKRSVAPNVFAHIDAAGRLLLTVVGEGTLVINERDLAYVHGDIMEF